MALNRPIEDRPISTITYNPNIPLRKQLIEKDKVATAAMGLGLIFKFTEFDPLDIGGKTYYIVLSESPKIESAIVYLNEFSGSYTLSDEDHKVIGSRYSLTSLEDKIKNIYKINVVLSSMQSLGPDEDEHYKTLFEREASECAVLKPSIETWKEAYISYVTLKNQLGNPALLKIEGETWKETYLRFANKIDYFHRLVNVDNYLEYHPNYQSSLVTNPTAYLYRKHNIPIPLAAACGCGTGMIAAESSKIEEIVGLLKHPCMSYNLAVGIGYIHMWVGAEFAIKQMRDFLDKFEKAVGVEVSRVIFNKSFYFEGYNYIEMGALQTCKSIALKLLDRYQKNGSLEVSLDRYDPREFPFLAREMPDQILKMSEEAIARSINDPSIRVDDILTNLIYVSHDEKIIEKIKKRLFEIRALKDSPKTKISPLPVDETPLVNTPVEEATSKQPSIKDTQPILASETNQLPIQDLQRQSPHQRHHIWSKAGHQLKQKFEHLKDKVSNRHGRT